MAVNDLQKIASYLRYSIITISTKAGSGHPSSSLSAVELMTSLYFDHLRFDLKNPKYARNDRVIFSKGHATPLFYSLYEVAGAISAKDLSTYRQFDSAYEGHPTPSFEYTEAATGSLGQGLSIGVGQAMALKKQEAISDRIESEDSVEVTAEAEELDEYKPTVYVLIGDGELAEGSVWEAAAIASTYKLDNLVAIVDINRLGQSGPTMHEHNADVYRRRFEAFGWGAIVIDGHDWSQIDAAYEKAKNYQNGPVVILAVTTKGKGVASIEDKNGWHGTPLPPEEAKKAIASLGNLDKSVNGTITPPPGAEHHKSAKRVTPARKVLKKPAMEDPSYEPETAIATRKAFGKALVRVGKAYDDMVVLDADVKNSTYTQEFESVYPNRFYQMYIAEQNMVGAAVGMASRGYQPWVSTFACFLTRAFDQIRMAGLSGLTLRFNGSHAGTSIGEDGGSQMGLEDMAMFRAVLGSAVLYPADAYATERLVEEMMRVSGISYIRTTRPDTPILYSPKDEFLIGGSKLHKSTARRRFTVIAAGITVHEALKAQMALEKQGVGVAVLDAYSIKPIDDFAIEEAADASELLVVVEDHYSQGGLGDAITSVLAGLGSRVPVKHLAVDKVPRSGPYKKLLDFQGIGAKTIEDTIRSFLDKDKPRILA